MASPALRPHPARDLCLAPGRVDAPLAGAGRYGRLFPELAALDADEALLHALGTPGGACDGAPLEAQGADDGHVAAGWPFFGQFVAHDLTADRSPLAHHADGAALRNARTPRVNLECVFGAGPVGMPYLYDRDDPAKLLLGPGGTDVPRNAQGVALLGDPRNDVHLFVNQLHTALLRVHNVLVDRLRADGVPEAGLADEARRATTWHVQWVLLHDYLPTVAGDELALDVLAGGPCWYRPGADPFVPLEFADAAFRYGHSQIRHRYRINAATEPLPMFPDLMGFGPIPPDLALDCGLMFDLPGRPPAQRAKRIDGRLPASLIALPQEITGDVDDPAYRSLAARDLQRGQATGLPSGEAVARRMGATPLTREEVGLAEHGWEAETPLWYYVLREADVRGDGDRLGPVGGRIVAETLVGVLDADPGSLRNADPGWRPTLPAAEPGGFGIGDLLAAAEPAPV